jgi:hypothetical protein
MPLWGRLVIGLIGIVALLFGGIKVLQTVRSLSGADGQFIGDRATNCMYPETYVALKERQALSRGAEPFIPMTRFVRFNSRQEGLRAGYRPCQN